MTRKEDASRANQYFSERLSSIILQNVLAKLIPATSKEHEWLWFEKEKGEGSSYQSSENSST